ncbi:Hypothetical predicted protein [Scomber scombrus]|uniref:Uncharacterized protein n=1 Tax=Scomber scombrus TaxID=13677 RepID=A0AAV1NS12_SCOSC
MKKKNEETRGGKEINPYAENMDIDRDVAESRKNGLTQSSPILMSERGEQDFRHCLKMWQTQLLNHIQDIGEYIMACTSPAKLMQSDDHELKEMRLGLQVLSYSGCLLFESNMSRDEHYKQCLETGDRTAVGMNRKYKAAKEQAEVLKKVVQKQENKNHGAKQTAQRPTKEASSHYKLQLSSRNQRVYPEKYIMACTSPAKLMQSDDHELKEMRLGLQVLSYSSCLLFESNMSRDEHYKQCLETGDRTLKIAVGMNRKYKAAKEQAEVLKKVVQKQETEIMELNRQLKDLQKKHQAITNYVSDAELIELVKEKEGSSQKQEVTDGIPGEPEEQGLFRNE